jgi:hypothetical protein
MYAAEGFSGALLRLRVIPLATYFRSGGFDFKQLARERDVALFRKAKLFKRPAGHIAFETFEVVIVQKMEEHEWPNGDIQPAHEHMPGEAQCGVYGWSLQDRESAWAKFRALRDEPAREAR